MFLLPVLHNHPGGLPNRGRKVGARRRRKPGGCKTKPRLHIDSEYLRNQLVSQVWIAQNNRNGRVTKFIFHFYTMIWNMSRVVENQRFRFPRVFFRPYETRAGLGWYFGPSISGGATLRPSYVSFRFGKHVSVHANIDNDTNYSPFKENRSGARRYLLTVKAVGGSPPGWFSKKYFIF